MQQLSKQSVNWFAIVISENSHMFQFSAVKQVLRFLKKVCEESGGFTDIPRRKMLHEKPVH